MLIFTSLDSGESLCVMGRKEAEYLQPLQLTILRLLKPAMPLAKFSCHPKTNRDAKTRVQHCTTVYNHPILAGGTLMCMSFSGYLAILAARKILKAVDLGSSMTVLHVTPKVEHPFLMLSMFSYVQFSVVA